MRRCWPAPSWAAPTPLCDALGRYAREIGLAFQIVDDILDVEGASASLGKTAGKDAASGKPTYVALYGLRVESLAAQCLARAEEALAAAGLQDSHLAGIARWIVERRTWGDHPHAPRRPAGAQGAGRVPREGTRPDSRRAGGRRRAWRAKAGTMVNVDTDVRVIGPDHPWASRGGLKLVHAIDVFAHRRDGPPGPRHRRVDRRLHRCAPRRGARRVVALDVGHSQLDWRLRTDPRVVVIEGVNARHLTPELTRRCDRARTSSPSMSRSSRCDTSCPSCRRCSRRAPDHRPGQAAVRGRPRRRRHGGHRARCRSTLGWWRRHGAGRSGRIDATGPGAVANHGAEGNREFLLWLGLHAGATPREP